jgi:hypothetical protein
MKRIRGWTDYPITKLGDAPHVNAPIRRAEVLTYDGGRYCLVRVSGVVVEIKAGYLYVRRGRLGHVPQVLAKHLDLLPRTVDRWSVALALDSVGASAMTSDERRAADETIELAMVRKSLAGAWSERLAVALRNKGLVAHWGPTWDGADDHREPTFWYFHPTANGGVGAYVGYDGGTYDMGILEPGDIAAALVRVDALPRAPSRLDVWEALGCATDD